MVTEEVLLFKFLGWGSPVMGQMSLDQKPSANWFALQKAGELFFFPEPGQIFIEGLADD